MNKTPSNIQLIHADGSLYNGAFSAAAISRFH